MCTTPTFARDVAAVRGIEPAAYIDEVITAKIEALHQKYSTNRDSATEHQAVDPTVERFRELLR